VSIAWDWLVLPGLVAGLLVLALSVFVYRAAPRDRGLILAVFLFLWGSQTVLNALPLLWSDGSTEEAAMDSLFWITLAAALFAYLWFVSTLDSPFTRRLRRKVAVAYWCAALLLLWFMMLDATFFTQRGPGSRLVSSAIGLGVLYGLIVAAGAWWRARRTARRAQAKSYFVAAVGHDLLLVPMAIWFGLGSPGASPDQETFIVLTVPPVAALWLAAFLAYGMLRHHIFGIDLKVKWTLKRGTLVGALAVVFFVAKEGVEAFLPGEGALAGISGAAVVAALAFPMWRGAARVTDTLMPGVADTPEYRERRARDVYRAAIGDAMRDGEITAKERGILAGLRHNLGLTAAEARRMERAAVGDEGSGETVG
jgi:hypothetical protein